MKAYLLSFLLLALASCTQQDPTTGTTTVEGQVVAEASRQPVPRTPR